MEERISALDFEIRPGSIAPISLAFDLVELKEVPEIKPKSFVDDPVPYIKNLSRLLDIDISRWDLFTLFSCRGTLIKDKGEINKIFMAKITEALQEPEVITLSPQILNALKHHQALPETKENLKRSLSQAKRDYQSLFSSMQSQMQIMKDAAKAIQRCEKNIVSEVQKINPFFKIYPEDSGSGYISFITDECIIDFRRPGDGKQFKINFGHFKVKAYFSHQNVTLIKSSGNVEFRKFYHPFVSKSGSICFGEQGDMICDFMAKGEWANYFETLKVLLTSYHPDAYPYHAIETFYYFGLDQNGSHPWRPDSDSITMEELIGQVNQGMDLGCSDCGSEGHDSDDCRMTSCGACEARYNVDDGHDCPYIDCEDCNITYSTDEGHNCRATCGECDHRYGWDGSLDHTCPEEAPEEAVVP